MAGSLFLAWSIVLVAALVAHGYGVAVLRLCRQPPAGWALTAAIGLAGLALLGGVANLFHMAVPVLLLILVAIGVALDLGWGARGGWRCQGAALRAYGLGPALVAAAAIVAVLSFVAATQFPPAAVNLHDDLEKYFAFPTRMLATGTLSGSPLSALGIETLGGQAWFHGFLLAVLPIPYINGFDALICLGLAMLLLAGCAASRAMPAGALAIAVLVAIDPQYVNVSSLYYGVALSLALVLWLAGRSVAAAWMHGIVPGLLLAALVAAKPSLGLFPVMVVLAAAAMVSMRRVRPAVVGLAGIALWSALFVAPWLALYATQYGAWTASPSGSDQPLSVPLTMFFSAAPLPSGAVPLLYTAAAGAAALMALAMLTGWRREREQASSVRILAAAILAGAAVYLAETWFLARYQSSFGIALRYGLIDILVVVPLGVAIAWRDGGRWRAATRAGSLLLAVGVIVAFAPSLWARVEQASTYGHVLAFPWLSDRSDYLAYNRARLAPEANRGARAIQGLVPTGEPILVWTESPFHLDFARNPIIDVQPAGLATPWAQVPPVRYLIWEYRGFAVRPAEAYEDAIEDAGLYERIIARRSLAFTRTLDAAARSGRILYNDGWVVAVQLAAPLDQRWRDMAP